MGAVSRLGGGCCADLEFRVTVGARPEHEKEDEAESEDVRGEGSEGGHAVGCSQLRRSKAARPRLEALARRVGQAKVCSRTGRTGGRGGERNQYAPPHRTSA